MPFEADRGVHVVLDGRELKDLLPNGMLPFTVSWHRVILFSAVSELKDQLLLRREIRRLNYKLKLRRLRQARSAHADGAIRRTLFVTGSSRLLVPAVSFFCTLLILTCLIREFI